LKFSVFIVFYSINVNKILFVEPNNLFFFIGDELYFKKTKNNDSSSIHFIFILD